MLSASRRAADVKDSGEGATPGALDNGETHQQLRKAEAKKPEEKDYHFPEPIDSMLPALCGSLRGLSPQGLCFFMSKTRLSS